LAELLGFLRAGARDVIDIHNETLRSFVKDKSSSQARIFMEESRIVLLQLMGDLLSFYRHHFSENQIQHLKGFSNKDTL